MSVVPTPHPLPAALLCDMDGTLVDTERLWLRTVADLLEEFRLLAGPEVVAELAGLTLADSAELLTARHGVPIPVPQLIDRLDGEFLDRAALGVAIQPGAIELLDRARELGIPTALVTASERSFTDLVLKTLGAERFDLTVAGAEGGRSKPYPDPYLYAAATLGADPSACVAVEDTATGTASALAAGCRVIVVPTVGGIPESPRITIIGSLTDFPLF